MNIKPTPVRRGTNLKKAIVGLAVLVGMLSGSRSASADEMSATNVLFPLVGFGTMDLGLATTDLVFGSKGKWPPRVYSGFETGAAALQIAICVDQALSSRRGLATTGGIGPPPSGAGWEVGAAIGTIFLAHGIVTLVAPRARLEIPTPTGPVTLAPVAFSDVTRASVPGLAALGRF
jgi:hypothetical protein